jgi:hypothetical protein
MATAGMICLGLALLISVVAKIQLIVLAFQESVLWGIGCFLPFVSLIFVVLNWHEAKRPFFLWLLAIPFYVAAYTLNSDLPGSR